MQTARHAEEMLLPEHPDWMPIFAGTLFGIATLTLSTRFALRLAGFGGPIGIEDALMVPAWFGGLAFAAVSVFFAYHNGPGELISFFPKDQSARAMMFVTFAKVAFVPGNGFAKVSVLLFCRRLVRGTGRWELKAVRWGAAIIAAAYVAFFIELWSVCRPFDSNWNRFDTDWDVRNQGKYICRKNEVIPDYLFTTLTVVSDLYATVLPAVIIWKTSMTLKKKVGLTILFSMGLLATFASIMRTVYIMGFFGTSRVLHSIFDAFMWANLELQLGVMCASAPALKVLCKRETQNAILKRLGLSRFVRSEDTTGQVRGGSPPVRLESLGIREDGSSFWQSPWTAFKAWRRARRERGKVMCITVTRETRVVSEQILEEGGGNTYASGRSSTCYYGEKDNASSSASSCFSRVLEAVGVRRASKA